VRKPQCDICVSSSLLFLCVIPGSASGLVLET